MANITLDASLKEIAKTLDLDKVPDKLHCAACHQFLFNAYKASCCDQFICETCFSAASTSCPICDHTPFNQDVCKPSKAVRGTAKAYLKMVEKTNGEDKGKTTNTAQETPVTIFDEAPTTEVNGSKTEDTPKPVEEPAVHPGPDEQELPLADQPQPSVEEAEDLHARLASDETDGGDDEVEIQVEPSQEEMESEEYKANLESMAEYAEFEETAIESKTKESNDESPKTMNETSFTNMMQAGFNGMDYNQMMQQMMAASAMAGFNPMMGMPMGGNSMSSGFLGGFGGPNGMNGMNMGMNFNSNQMFGAFNNLNNNMWQNNNPNAFPNGMGGDFGSNLGFSIHQSGNFHQQQFPNGDFQNGYYNRGYGRGRGRGRGGYGRGRGNFNQYPHNQPTNFTNFQDTTMGGNHPSHQQTKSQQDEIPIPTPEPAPEDDEFAPGGQEEVQEALGDDYDRPKPEPISEVQSSIASTPMPEQPPILDNISTSDCLDESTSRNNQDPAAVPVTKPDSHQDDRDRVAPPTSVATLIPEAYQDDLTNMMPPASAPLGPSSRYSGAREFSGRPRGHGRFSSQSRGALPILNSRIISPVQNAPRESITPLADVKGMGVVGAPTGPRAMREPPVMSSPVRTSSGGGFQIIGRASMTSRPSQSNISERARSPSPANGSTNRNGHDNGDYDGQNGMEYSFSRRASKIDRHDSYRQDSSRGDYSDREVDRDREDDRNVERDRRRRKLNRTDHDGYREYDDSQPHSRAESTDQRSSHRNQGDRDRYADDSKHRSSISKKRDEVQDYDDDYEMRDYDDRKEVYDSDTRNKHRGHSGDTKSHRHDDRDRAKDRTRDRDREREKTRDSRDKEREKEKDKARDRHHRDRNKDRDREQDRPRDRERERDRDREKDHRKRSRQDRDREDEYEQSNGNTPTTYNNNNIDDDEDSHHRSRRHKKSHRLSNLDSVVAGLPQPPPTTNGTTTDSRSHSHRSHQVPDTTTTSKPSTTTPAQSTAPEKDPHTLEREARNRERMLKEQQRREKAAAANDGVTGPSGGGSNTKRHRDRDRDRDRDRNDRDRDARGLTSRRVSYKYEDEAERGMLESERAAARWR